MQLYVLFGQPPYLFTGGPLSVCKILETVQYCGVWNVLKLMYMGQVFMLCLPCVTALVVLFGAYSCMQCGVTVLSAVHKSSVFIQHTLVSIETHCSAVVRCQWQIFYPPSNHVIHPLVTASLGVLYCLKSCHVAEGSTRILEEAG